MKPASSRALRLALPLLAILAFAALAVGSGLDRLSAAAPPLERLTPAPFRAEAARAAATTALARGRYDAAFVQARAAIVADPVHARPAALLGAARLAEGDLDGAEEAFRVAALFGWREPMTQLYWYEAAIEAQDYPRAAERLDAVLRVRPRLAQAADLVGQLESAAPGRAELARRLARDPAWRDFYLQPPEDADATLLHHRADIAVMAAKVGQPFGCTAPKALAWALLGIGDRPAAVRVWNAHCAARPAGTGLSDPDFRQLAAGGETGPFGWRRHPRGDLRFDVLDAGGEAAIRARNTSAVSRLLLSQVVALPPGRYQLRVDSGAKAAIPDGALAASLDCGGAPRVPARVEGDPAGGGQILRPADCEGQTLGLWLRPGTDEIRLARVRLEPADAD